MERETPELRALLREFTEWAIVHQHGVGLATARAIINGAPWPNGQPSPDSLIKRAIAVLNSK
jgi:hypothetical protein